MKIRVSLWVVVTILTIPPLLNLLGHNLFLYLGGESRKLVVAASHGLCHLASTSEATDVPAGSDFMPEYSELHSEILKLGPIEIFSEERIDPMQWLRFRVSPKSETFDYSAIEFPWLLLPVAPLFAIYLIRMRKLSLTKR